MKKIRNIVAAISASLIVATGMFYFAIVRPALAGVTCSLPFTLTNGTVADATQVMANYNALVTCLTNAAAAGANNDITSLSALTTPITPNEGGSNIYIGTPTVSGNILIIGSATVPTGWANVTGQSVVFVAPVANTTAEQLVVNNQATKNVYKLSSAGPIPLTGGEIVTSQVYQAIYDGTQFEINPFPNVTAGWGISVVPTAVSINTTNPPYGFGPCVNMTIEATVGSGLLGLQLLAADSGLAPTNSHPILCNFRDTTIANGDPVWTTVASPTYMDTNAIGATLGTVTATAFKLWLVLFNNGGSPVIGLWNSGASAVTPQVNSLNEGVLASTTGISNAANSVGTFYTPNGTNLTNKAFRIIGYLEYSSGLTTAGDYTSAPTILQLFGPGIKKPGDIIQELINTSSISTTIASGETKTALTLAIAPSSTANLIAVDVDANGILDSSSTTCFYFISRGTTFTTPTSYEISVQTIGAVSWSGSTHLQALDFPKTTSSTTYVPWMAEAAGGSNCVFNGQQSSVASTQSFIKAMEIQG